MALPVVDTEYLKEIDRARRHLRSLIAHKNCAPIMLRLAWHDAGTYDANTRTGGANGSIRNREEYSHGSNAGLKIAIDFCGPSPSFLASLLSFARRVRRPRASFCWTSWVLIKFVPFPLVFLELLLYLRLAQRPHQLISFFFRWLHPKFKGLLPLSLSLSLSLSLKGTHQYTRSQAKKKLKSITPLSARSIKKKN